MLSSVGVLRRLHKLVDQQWEAIVFHNLAVVRHVIFRETIEILFSDFQRIRTKMSRNAVDDRFDCRHSLRTAKPPEGSIRRQVRFPDSCKDRHVRNKIGVITMQHRPFHDRKRKIRCCSCITIEFEFDSPNSSFIIKARFIPNEESVTFSRHDHVIITEQANLHRASGCPTEQGTPTRSVIGLRFLATESASHPSNFDDDILFPDAKNFSNNRLRFVWIL